MRSGVFLPITSWIEAVVLPIAGIKMKRFYKNAVVIEIDTGYGIELDGKLIRTPRKSAFLVDTRKVADAVAAEWMKQGDEIVVEDMPILRLANTAIDMISHQRSAVVDNLAGYGNSDLLCYRVDSPAELVRRQNELWSPWLVWARDKLHAELRTTSGIHHITQNENALSALRAAVDRNDNMELASLNDLVTISGSLVLGLAVCDGVLDVETAWKAVRLDDNYQAEKWGEDTEAEARAASLFEEFKNAVLFLSFHRIN